MIPFIGDLVFCLKTAYKFRGYSPQRVLPRSVWNWLKQYPIEDRALVKNATAHLQYINERDFTDGLCDRNKALLTKLTASGISNKNIIYVSVGDAGSSSHMVLNLLRDRALLENSGCVLIHAADSRKLFEVTTRIGSGAIIYVDDFSGTGNQFCEVRQFIGQFIAGNFSEYFLLHTVCEEAIIEISKTGVNHWAYRIHEKKVRPMHESSTILSKDQRQALEVLSKQAVKNKGALGYGNLASMVVFYKNSPNGVPPLFRGDKGQKKLIGLVPRTSDLPAPSY